MLENELFVGNELKKGIKIDEDITNAIIAAVEVLKQKKEKKTGIKL